MAIDKNIALDPPIITVGAFIRKVREEQRISQENLCHGICTTSNLSRIENGEQISTRAKLEAIMQRLGFSPDIFPSFLYERELEIYQMRNEINVRFDEGNFAEVETLLDKMEKECGREQAYKIFAAFIRTMLLRERDGTTKDVLKGLENVVHMSIKNFSMKRIPWLILSKSDISMLENLARAYYDTEQKERAFDMLYALKEYIEKEHVHFNYAAANYISILYMLSNWVGLSGNYEEKLRLCEAGLLCCVKYGICRYWGKLLFNKGDALVKLSRTDEALKFIQESYYLERSLGNRQRMDMITEYAKTNGFIL